MSETVQDMTKVTMTDWYEVAYALSIGTKVDDLKWPWTAVSSNFLVILRYVLFLGGNIG